MTKTLEIPTNPESITADWLSRALRSTGTINQQSIIKSFEREAIGEATGGLGQLARIKIDDAAENGGVLLWPSSEMSGYGRMREPVEGICRQTQAPKCNDQSSASLVR